MDLDPGVVDLLGVLCYGELVAFERIAADAALAPGLADREAIAAMAVAEFGHHQRLLAHLRAAGLDPDAVMEPFRRALDEFHDSTRPNDWVEGLVKVVVGDGFARDFYREVAAFIDDPVTRDLVLGVLAETDATGWALERIRRAISEDPVIGGRLALWARRLVGEALSQAQSVAAERDDLARMLVGGIGDLAAFGELLGRLTSAHAERMGQLGLQP